MAWRPPGLRTWGQVLRTRRILLFPAASALTSAQEKALPPTPQSPLFTSSMTTQVTGEHLLTFEIDQLIDDPHVQERGVLVEAPDDEAGSVLMHNIIPRLSETPGQLRFAAPALGQHTRSILESIGCDPARIAELAADGVIKEA